MGIGFAFKTSPCEREAAFAALDKAAAAHDAWVVKGEQDAVVNLCRAGDLLLRYKDGQVTGDCQTNVAGPGFHVAAIRLLDAFAKEAGVELEVDDEAEYFDKRNFDELREQFHGWLGGIMGVLREQTEKGELRNFCLCWDLAQYQPADVPGTVVTPLGRRDIAAMLQQAQEQGVEALARDFFVWYNKAKDALFHRNTALAVLWEDCYFMPSSRSERDARINGSILTMLEQAAQLDRERELPFPKESYALLCELDRREAKVDVSALPALQCPYPVGYRRGTVQERLGAVSMPVPGHYLYEAQNEGRDHVYYDALEADWHTIRATAFGAREPQDSFSDELFEGCEPETFEVGEGRCRAAYAGEQEDEDGGRCHQTIAQVLSGFQVTFFTLSYQNLDQQDWAMRFLRGLKVKLPQQQP